MRQLELDFDAVPGVVQLAPYLLRQMRMRNPTEPAADIVIFPLSRRRCTIQDVALQFRSFRGRKRQLFWQETIAGMRNALEEANLTAPAIQRQLLEFRDAVERELCPDEHDPRYGGAA